MEESLKEAVNTMINILNTDKEILSHLDTPWLLKFLWKEGQ